MVNTMFMSFQNCMLNSRLLSVKVLEGSSLGDNYKFYFLLLWTGLFYLWSCYYVWDCFMNGIIVLKRKV